MGGSSFGQHARWALRYTAAPSIARWIVIILCPRMARLEKVACIAQAPALIFQEAPPASWSSARLGGLLHVGGYSAAKDCAVVAAASTLLELDETATFTGFCHRRLRAALATPPSAVRPRAQAIP